MTPTEPKTESEGFHGDVTGLSLSDVIQLNGQNGFSGCITVQHGSRTGRIFFREGKIIHAEQAGKSGEEAFYDIMEWRSGHFSLERNVSTTSHTSTVRERNLWWRSRGSVRDGRSGRNVKGLDPSALCSPPRSA